MNRNHFRRDILVLLVSLVITVITWVSFETYRAFAKPHIPEGLEQHLTPFNPTLDTGVLDQLEKRLPL